MAVCVAASVVVVVGGVALVGVAVVGFIVYVVSLLLAL